MILSNRVVLAIEPYFVLNNEGTTLTFYCDNLAGVRKGISMNGLSNYSTSVTSIIFDKSFANCKSITSTKNWLKDFSKLTEIVGFNYFDTSNVTDMSYMFENCSSLISLDLSGFNTQKVTNMGYMFYNCSSLTSLNISNFNTENVTDMEGIFRFCSSLTSLDVSSFNTENVTNMGLMFYGCKSLESLDLRTFNTYNVTTMSNMFDTCSSLTSLDLSSFNTENVISMQVMFDDCSSLVDINLSSFNTKKVKQMYAMFRGCSSLKVVDLSSFDTERVTGWREMFYHCSSLETIYVGYMWKTAGSWQGMFDNCLSLVGGQGTKFIDHKVTDGRYAHIDLGPEGPGYMTFKDPTGIKNIFDESLINNGNKWYSIDGKQIKKPRKLGIFIKGNKKFLDHGSVDHF